MTPKNSIQIYLIFQDEVTYPTPIGGMYIRCCSQVKDPQKRIVETKADQGRNLPQILASPPRVEEQEYWQDAVHRLLR